MPLIECRHDTDISDPQSLYASNPKSSIQNSTSVVSFAHLTGAAGMVASSGMLFDIRFPILTGSVGMMLEGRRPRAFHDVLGPSTFHDDFIAEGAGFGEDEQVERVGKIVVIHDGVLARVAGGESHGAAGLWGEELRDYGEGVLIVDGEVGVLFGATVAFGGEEFDVGLVWSEAH